jgi:hypothetical protein
MVASQAWQHTQKTSESLVHMRELPHVFLKIILTALALLLAAYGMSLLLNPDIAWSNPEYLVFSVPGSVDNGLALNWKDLFKAFDPMTFDVIRPRFLNYLITVINVKFRLALYEEFIPPVNLSLMLLVHLGASPLLMFLTVRNLVKSGSIAVFATCLYLTSVGFLSSGIFFVQPGKVLIHPMALLLIWVLSLIQKHDHGKFFAEHSPRLVALVFILNFIALSLDDTYIVVSLVAYLLFWRLFLPKSLTIQQLRRAILSSFIFFLPFLLFAVFVWKVAPELSEVAGAGRCDYFGFVLDQSSSVTKTPLWPVFRDLTTTAIASSFLLRPYPEAMSGVALKLTNFQILFVIAMLAVIAIFAFLGARKTTARSGWTTNPITAPFAALLCYFIFQAVLQRFHIQITGGYYYSSLTGIFVSIFAAHALASLQPRVSILGRSALLIMMTIQLLNFIDINQRWKNMHMPLIPYSLSTVRDIYRNVISDDFKISTPEQRQRMESIYKDWKTGVRRDLSSEPNWPGSMAWFLVEMNALSGFVYRDTVRKCKETKESK